MAERIVAFIPEASQLIQLRRGMKLRAGDDELEIDSFVESGVRLKNLKTNEHADILEDALYSAIQREHVLIEGYKPRIFPYQLRESDRIIAAAQGATRRAVDVWEAKVAWLNGLREAGIDKIADTPRVHDVIEKLANGKLAGIQKFSRTTLYEAHLEIRKAKGDIAVALPKYQQRGGPGQSRLDTDVFAIVCNCIDEAVNREDEHIVKADIYSEVQDAVEKLNAACPDRQPKPVPGETTVMREIAKKIPAQLILARRKGKHVAKKEYRSHSQSRDLAERPLEVVEFDDIDSGVFCVDERSGLPWGRPWITNGVDQYSRIVTGFDLSDRTRSFESALGALCHTLLPKEGLRPGQMGYGFPGVCLMDNARYNESQAMLKQSAALRILLAPCRPRGPTEKNANEHFNGIVKHNHCAKLPGWVGDKGDREGTAVGMAVSCMDIGAFRTAYQIWVTTKYPLMVGDDGLNAKQRWIHGTRHGPPAVRYTAAELALLRLRPLNRPLKFRASGGLMRLRLRYDNGQLDLLRRRMGSNANVEVFVDPLSMAFIYVLNPFDRKLMQVESTEQADYILGLNERQQSLILKMCWQRGNKNPDARALIEARDELRKLVAQARLSNKLRTRLWSRRMGDQKVEDGQEQEAPVNKPKAATASATEKRVMTDLEYEIEELQLVELEEADQW